MEFPSLNIHSKRFISTNYENPYKTWEEALSEIGEIYKNARSSLEKKHNYERRGFVARPIEVKTEKAKITVKINNLRSGNEYNVEFLKPED